MSLPKIQKEIKDIVARALKEDAVKQDVTSRLLIGLKQKVTAHIIAKEKGILCGVWVAREILTQTDPECRIQFLAKDGEKVEKGQKLMTFKGNARKILSAERTILNFIQHLSGIATLTNKFVTAVMGTKAGIFDTRKTLPGLRILQKYAVRVGGGKNHRMDLSQMVMVKDNHFRVILNDNNRVTSLKTNPLGKIALEVEAKNMDEVNMALKSKADIILLDNMSIRQLRKAVDYIRNASLKSGTGHIPLIEVSGGVSLENVCQIAHLGVDRISVGALTHSAPALDISLEVE